MNPTTPQHIHPKAKQSLVGTQGPCVRRCAKVETQRIALPSGHAYATGVQQCDTGADVRAVRPYKPHPSHAVLCYTVSMEGTVGDCTSMPAMTRKVTAMHVETSHCGVSTIQHQASPRDVARYVSTSGTLLEGISNVETLHATSPTHHINPKAKQSPVGTQGPCVRRCAKVGTQRVAFPSDHANPTGVQRCDTGADVRAVRPYKPHPSHAVLCYTASMEGTVGDCASTPTMTREVTATSPIRHINPRAKQSPVGTQGPCVRRCAWVGTQRVAFPSDHANPTGVQRCDSCADVRAVRPYKPHPSHAVLFYTASMAGTVWDCGSLPARTRNVTTTNVETSHCGVSTKQHTLSNVPQYRQQANKEE